MAGHLAPRFAAGRFFMRDNIMLDHMGRELPQDLSGGRMNPLPDHHALGRGFVLDLVCDELFERRMPRRSWPASWINLADRRRRNPFFDSIGQTGNANVVRFAPLATEERTFRIGSFVPIGDIDP
jgi:hypothetical protein